MLAQDQVYTASVPGVLLKKRQIWPESFLLGTLMNMDCFSELAGLRILAESSANCLFYRTDNWESRGGGRQEQNKVNDRDHHPGILFTCLRVIHTIELGSFLGGMYFLLVLKPPFPTSFSLVMFSNGHMQILRFIYVFHKVGNTRKNAVLPLGSGTQF